MTHRAKAIAVLLLLVFGTASSGHAEDAPVDTIVLTGEITHDDHQSYIELPFEVPEGVARLDISFDYTGREERTTIDLGLIDPRGERGWSGGNKKRFTVSAIDATPSYFTGPVYPGTWKLLLGVPNIREGVTARYEATIALYADPDAGMPLSAPVTGKQGWHRGDFHSHSAHSDGSCLSLSGKRVPCPAFRMLGAAAERGLDFLSLTDHNARSQTVALRELAPYFDTMTLIPGREVTTFFGHFNVFGTVKPIDFRLSDAPGAVNQLFDAANAAGGTISINHPALPAGEACMGCGWVASDTDFSKVHAIEVVNGGTLMKTGGIVEHPYSGIPFWENLLDQGHRLTAIAGSDSHDPDTDLQDVGSVGKPMTVLWADSRNAADLLAALRAGRVFVDILGTQDSVLALTASLDGADYRMGDTVSLTAGGELQLKLTVRSETGETIDIVEDGEVIRQMPVPAGKGAHEIDFTLSEGSQARWVRANVRDAAGNIILLGNPIYLEHPN